MRRWNNGGLWDIALLSAQERWLRELYSRVLHLCNESKPLRIGEFFDFMYVNLNNKDLDPHSIFAFMRYVRDEEVVLVVANFSDRSSQVKLIIPQLAFEMSGMQEAALMAKDLLSGREVPLVLSRTSSTLVEVGSKSAAVLGFSLR